MVFQGRRWCVMVDCFILHPELLAGVSGAAHFPGLWIEDVKRKSLGANCWSQLWFHHHCTFLGFIKVHSLLIWVIAIVIPLIWHIATIVVMIYSGRVIQQSTSCNLINWLFSPKIKSSWGTHLTSPFFCITYQVHPGPGRTPFCNLFPCNWHTCSSMVEVCFPSHFLMYCAWSQR